MVYGVHTVYLEIPCNYVVGRAWLSCKAPVYQIQTVITGFHPEYNSHTLRQYNRERQIYRETYSPLAVPIGRDSSTLSKSPCCLELQPVTQEGLVIFLLNLRFFPEGSL
jgi:hypothetical protein